jgi:hypothetical protein
MRRLMLYIKMKLQRQKEKNKDGGRARLLGHGGILLLGSRGRAVLGSFKRSASKMGKAFITPLILPQPHKPQSACINGAAMAL